MQHSLQCLLCLLLLTATPIQLSVHAAEAEKQQPGHELVQTLLTWYNHEEYRVRQQAYFLSAGVPPYPELVAKLLDQQAKGDAAEKAVISYALATITRSPEHIEAFLRDFPLTESTYYKAFYANYTLELMILPMQFFLRELAYEEEYAERAKYLFWVVFYNPDMVHPRGPDDDAVLKAYHDKHQFEDFMLKEDNYHTKDLSDSLRRLVKSDDVATRRAAQGMLYLFTSIDTLDSCSDYYNMAESQEETVTLSSLCTEHQDKIPNIDSQEAVQNLFKFIQNTYNNPGQNILTRLEEEKTCTQENAECRYHESIHKHGMQYLNAYQRSHLRRLFPDKQ